MKLFKKKKETPEFVYDSTKMQPVIKASICTGEQVAGFKMKDTGRFEEIMVIRNTQDMASFLETYGVSSDEIRKEY